MGRLLRRRLAPLGLALAWIGCGPRVSTAPGEQIWGSGQRGRARVVMSRSTAPEGEEAPIVDVLEQELGRNLAQLQDGELEEPAYFLAYDLVEVDRATLAAQGGALLVKEHDVERTIDVDVRVGSPKLDNSHGLGGNYGPGNGLGSGVPVSVQDVRLSLAQSLWLETESQYRDAVAALSEVRSSEQLRSETDEPAHPDFSEEKVTVHVEPRLELDLEAAIESWTPTVRSTSAVLDDDPHVLESRVMFSAVVQNRHFVSSEGARVQGAWARLRIDLIATAQAEDGMVLQRAENLEVHTPEQLASMASQEKLHEMASRMREELVALREAPVAEPYTGPAVLEARAAGVFFHEIFGHRLEGHRQKDDLEGQTFSEMVGERVLPSFLDVVDDPTVTTLGGTPLSGHYFVDDEGVPARRTVLVQRGKLRGFLLGRSPVLPFRRSNGHGRREPGHQVVARQGNLIVTSRRTLRERDMKEELIDEIKRQGKPYGLWFSDIEGGYTLTDRTGPQAFKVLPLMVYRVFADGRPDELVRGVDIVGTPLAALETIIGTGDQPGIFNGLCGAESGWVSVAAVSPSLLLKNIEIEKAAYDRDRPPLLPPPRPEGRSRR